MLNYARNVRGVLRTPLLRAAGSAHDSQASFTLRISVSLGSRADMENTALKVELMQDPWSSLNMVLLSTILIRSPLIIGYGIKPALGGDWH